MMRNDFILMFIKEFYRIFERRINKPSCNIGNEIISSTPGLDETSFFWDPEGDSSSLTPKIVDRGKLWALISLFWISSDIDSEEEKRWSEMTIWFVILVWKWDLFSQDIGEVNGNWIGWFISSLTTLKGELNWQFEQ
jgi:hypothetical protein